MSTFTLTGNPDDLIPIVFPVNEDGYIQFGFAGFSTEPHDSLDVANTPIQISDYILEGFVKYKVFVQRTDRTLVVEIQKQATIRDKSIDWFVRKWIQHRGCVIESELETES